MPCVLELIQFFPFDERVLKSSSSVIAMRRLSFENESTRDSLSRDLIAMEIAQVHFVFLPDTFSDFAVARISQTYRVPRIFFCIPLVLHLPFWPKSQGWTLLGEFNPKSGSKAVNASPRRCTV